MDLVAGRPWLPRPVLRCVDGLGRIEAGLFGPASRSLDHPLPDSTSSTILRLSIWNPPHTARMGSPVAARSRSATSMPLPPAQPTEVVDGGLRPGHDDEIGAATLAASSTHVTSTSGSLASFHVGGVETRGRRIAATRRLPPRSRRSDPRADRDRERVPHRRARAAAQTAAPEGGPAAQLLEPVEPGRQQPGSPRNLLTK